VFPCNSFKKTLVVAKASDKFAAERLLGAISKVVEILKAS
jgi:hypothetical protein